MHLFATGLTLACTAFASQEPAPPAVVQRELRIYALNELAEAPGPGDWVRVGDGGSIRIGGRYATEAEGGKEASAHASIIFDGVEFGPNQERVREWATLAARFCEPALDPQQERIDPEKQGYLISYLQPVQHAWLESFLALQRGAAVQWMAQVDSRIYSVPQGTLARMQLTGSATLLADAAAIADMQKRIEAAKPELVSSPRLTTLPGQRGNLSVLNEVSYVKEYELHVVEPGNVEILDPVVDVIQEGIIMELQVLQVSEGLYGLELSCQQSKIDRPIPTKKVKPSPILPGEFEVGMPEVHTAKVNATVRLADGAGVLLIAAGEGKGGEIAILLTFRRQDTAPEAEVRRDF